MAVVSGNSKKFTSFLVSSLFFSIITSGSLAEKINATYVCVPEKVISWYGNTFITNNSFSREIIIINHWNKVDGNTFFTYLEAKINGKSENLYPIDCGEFAYDVDKSRIVTKHIIKCSGLSIFPTKFIGKFGNATLSFYPWPSPWPSAEEREISYTRFANVIDIGLTELEVGNCTFIFSDKIN